MDITTEIFALPVLYQLEAVAIYNGVPYGVVNCFYAAPHDIGTLADPIPAELVFHAKSIVMYLKIPVVPHGVNHHAVYGRISVRLKVGVCPVNAVVGVVNLDNPVLCHFDKLRNSVIHLPVQVSLLWVKINLFHNSNF